MPLLFPTTQELTYVVRNTTVDPTRFIGNSFCPTRDVFAAEIEYDVIGATVGMTSAHNLGTDPKVVNLSGLTTKKAGTGYWKETKRINEAELLKARAAGSLTLRAGRLLVTEKTNMMNTRLETRKEWCIWQPLVSGQIQVDENGVKYTLNYDMPAKNKLVFKKSWNDPDADIPSDITGCTLLYRGTGARAVKVFFNLQVAGYIAANNKIKGLLANTTYAAFLSSQNIIQALNLLFPSIQFIIYDEGYVDERGTFNPFIPDDRLIMIGEGQPGELLMDFGTTISLHNGGLEQPLPGKFCVIEDQSEQAKNPFIDLTVGIYGLPRLYHPNWVVSAKVAQ